MLVAPAALQAQLKIGDRPVDFHGFIQQGFAYSDANNYMTMKTSKGSAAFTDGALNAGVSITDKFRVGAQGYVRNIGELGNGQIQLDWAYGDYKFKDWFGVRAGKVKTALGLYNDTQDMEFLHTWAILPQSLYPLDLRASTIAHTGGDVYGEVALRKYGSLSYTGYFGRRSDDTRGGYRYGTQDSGSPINKFTGNMLGTDVRWNTKVEGLIVGYSFMKQNNMVHGTLDAYGGLPYTVESDPLHVNAFYTDYTRGKLRLSAEFRRTYSNQQVIALGAPSTTNASDKGWFGSAAYRVSDRLELGTYHSQYRVDVPNSVVDGADHIFDQAITARVDLTKSWNVKAEGHFMDGFGDTYSARGFYLRSNPNGLQKRTNMLVLRTGWSF